MKRTWGSLRIDVPEGWEDDTLVVLRAPGPGARASAGAKAAARPARTPTGEARRPTLLVKRVPLVGGTSLAMLAQAEAAMVEATVEGVKLFEPAPVDLGGTPGLMRELTFPGPDGAGKMRQLHVSAILDRTYVLFVGTALDDKEFPAAKAQFLAIARSARIAQS